MITRTSVIQAIPTVIACAALLAVGWWGHRNGWALSRATAETSGAHAGYWCAEHAIPEADCLLCRKSYAKKMRAEEPPAQVAADEEIRFAQVASSAAVAHANITTAASTATTHTPSLVVPAEIRYDPARVTRVATRLAGVVQQLPKRLGDTVAVGEMLAVIEAPEVGYLKSELMRTLAEHTATRTTAQRLSAAVDSGFKTVGEAHEANARVQAAQIAVFNAEQALLNLGFSLSAAALADLDIVALTTRLRALGLPDGTATGSANLLPIFATQAGTITAVHVVAGEAVAAGALLVIVADTRHLRLLLAVSSAQADTVAAGQTVTFCADGVLNGDDVLNGDGGLNADGVQSADGVLRTDSSTVHAGTVSLVAPAADEVTRLVPVFAAIDNPAGRLRANQVGSATIITGAAQPAVLVPPGAVQYDGPTAYVFVQRTPTIFRGLPVRILATTAAGLAVDRLIAGDVVAVTGTETLKGNLFQDKFGPGCACSED